MIIDWMINYLARKNVSAAINLALPSGTRFGLKGSRSFVNGCTAVNELTMQNIVQIGEPIPETPKAPATKEPKEG